MDFDGGMGNGILSIFIDVSISQLPSRMLTGEANAGEAKQDINVMDMMKIFFMGVSLVLWFADCKGCLGFSRESSLCCAARLKSFRQHIGNIVRHSTKCI
ncbi:MAG: hypothetical protein A3G79_02050 [Gallionellales bacterium RIFCSPLOWO2_12_FULL_57_18]|nr:MAG: hypothetical protein A3G79_02050 [Gallionellales bacterium RIFCSPLOWO2_12_FULL_57_18]